MTDEGKVGPTAAAFSGFVGWTYAVGLTPLALVVLSFAFNIEAWSGISTRDPVFAPQPGNWAGLSAGAYAYGYLLLFVAVIFAVFSFPTFLLALSLFIFLRFRIVSNPFAYAVGIAVVTSTANTWLYSRSSNWSDRFVEQIEFTLFFFPSFLSGTLIASYHLRRSLGRAG